MKLLFHPLQMLSLEDKEVAKAHVLVACATLTHLARVHDDKPLDELHVIPGREEALTMFATLSISAPKRVEKGLKKMMVQEISATELTLLLDFAIEIKPFQPIVEKVLSEEGVLVLEDITEALADVFILCTTMLPFLVRWS